MRRAILAALLLAGCQRNDKTRETVEAEPPQSSAVSTPAPVSVAPVNPAPPPEAPINQAPAAPLPPLPNRLPGKRTDLTAAVGSAWRAAIGDFNGDRKREIAIVDSKQMRVIDATGREIASVPVTSGIHVLVAADVDGDGK